MPESKNNIGRFFIFYLNKLSKAALASLALSISFLCPAVFTRYFGSSENQSQKLPRSLSAAGSAFVSEQSPFAPERKNLQFLQERRSLLQSEQRIERPIGSNSLMGEPQYQHIFYIIPYRDWFTSQKYVNIQKVF